MAAKKRVSRLTNDQSSSRETLLLETTNKSEDFSNGHIKKEQLCGTNQLITLIRDGYFALTTPETRLLDALICTSLTLMALQVIYLFSAGSYPFNSFLSGVFTSGGLVILSVAFRMQLLYPTHFNNIIPERALADFIFGCFVLFTATITFLG